MKKEEIRKYLDNTKVYVNGKSKEIQEKLFSFGYSWYGCNPTKVNCEDKPFLYIDDNKKISHGDSMLYFKEHEYREISAKQILSMKVTKPSYRPFKSQEECWNEMQKHQPFGWIMGKFSEPKTIVQTMFYNSIYISDKSYTYEKAMRMFTFADGTPFGIFEN